MRRCLAVALLLAAATLPLCAQRGGGAHGGFSGPRGGFSAPRGGFSNFSNGFSSHSASAFSRPGSTGSPGGFAVPPGRRAFAPASHTASPFTGAHSYNLPAAVRLNRPSFYTRSPVSPVRPGHPYRPHRPGSSGYGGVFLYGYPGWFGPGYFDLGFNDLGFAGLGFDNGYCDPDLDNCYAGDSYYGAPAYTADQAEVYYGNQPYAGSDQDGHAAPPPPLPSQAAPYGYVQQRDDAEPYPEYSYPQPSTAAQPPQSIPTQSSEDTVTLIFKDGRPPEQIRNYALTRTTLYVLHGSHRQDIPVDQLDLAATEKVNQDAGVDFQLPHPSSQLSGQSTTPASP